jgi:hypothetical protein
MKATHQANFTRGGVNQIRPSPVLFIPDEGKQEEEQTPQRTLASQVLKREKQKIVRSKYQRG